MKKDMDKLFKKNKKSSKTKPTIWYYLARFFGSVEGKQND